jgi:hypothetical protein
VTQPPDFLGTAKISFSHISLLRVELTETLSDGTRPTTTTLSVRRPLEKFKIPIHAIKKTLASVHRVTHSSEGI